MPSKPMSSMPEDVSGLRCKYCRFELFNDSSIFVGHSSPKKESFKGKQFALPSEHCSHYFLDQDQVLGQLKWLEEQVQVEEKSEGPIICGKCKHKLGSFHWNGTQCGCGAWQVPAIGIVKSKVDPIRTLRPYVHENTRSRPIAEVKHETVQSVLRWETTREYWML